MSINLYPIITARLNNKTAAQEIPILWQSLPLNKGEALYAVYHNYQSDHTEDYDYSIMTEMANEQQPLVIDDLTWYEKFITQPNDLMATWQSIWRKEKQGLLPRAYTVDFEKYLPEGKIEIYVAVRPHC